jgi:hypothetical protein
MVVDGWRVALWERASYGSRLVSTELLMVEILSITGGAKAFLIERCACFISAPHVQDL